MAKEPDKIDSAREEIANYPVEREPLPDSLGLTHTSSPVDLPEPEVPLPHDGLKWTTTVIVVASAFLLIFNAHALRAWAYELNPTDTTAKVVSAMTRVDVHVDLHGSPLASAALTSISGTACFRWS